ncbi:MAG: PaaI family thioesterase [Candidatus Alcyoniella australis]|nr:PaaI family thioesterase [Candidatus Alcyoniella australis]
MDEQTWRRLVTDIAQSSPFWSHLGITIEHIDNGYARLVMAQSEQLSNAGGVIHGGALSSLADSATAIAVLSLCDPQERVTTIEMKINFLTPAAPGKCICEARVVRKGTTTAVCDVEIFDAQGAMVCKALITYAVIHPQTRELIAKARQAPTS